MREIDSAGLKRLSAENSFRSTIRSDIFVIRQLPQAGQFRSIILRSFIDEYGEDEGEQVAKFLDVGIYPADETFVRLACHVERIRDARVLSQLFAPAIAELVGDDLSRTLADTGHVRFVIPLEMQKRLIGRVFHSPIDFQDAEVMVTASGGRAHRDIQAPHYTTQCNFWFPLHRIERREGLLMFPEVARKRASSYSQPTDTDPAEWGYGKPENVTLDMGDCLLFHSEQMHASPIVVPNMRPRATVEFRIATGCVDDNAVYRRLFWHVSNFAKVDTAEPLKPLAAKRMRWLEPFDQGSTVADVYYGLFNEFLDARKCVASLATADQIAGCLAVPAAEAVEICRKLMRLEQTGPDIMLFCAKLFGKFDAQADAVSALDRVAARSYFWALEAARVAFENGYAETAGTCIDAAEQHALAATMEIEPLGAPDANVASFQLLPAIALKACAAMRKALVADGKPKLFDFRLFTRRVELVRSYADVDLVKFELLYVAIPTTREIDPEKLMTDAGGLVWGPDPKSVGLANPSDLPKRTGRIAHLAAGAANDWVGLAREKPDGRPAPKPRLGLTRQALGNLRGLRRYWDFNRADAGADR